MWRGEVYYVDLDQPVGHEPAVRRPAVVVSVDILNNGPGGLEHTSYARCDQLRMVSVERLSSRQRSLVIHRVSTGLLLSAILARRNYCA